MIDVDDLVRDFRATLAVPPLSPPAHVADRATGARQRSPRPALVRRILGVTFGGLATAALATVLVVLLVAGGDRVNPASDARADWGLTVTMRVTAEPGQDQQATVDRVIAAIRSRATAQDVPGLVVEQVDPDRVRLQIPGAKWQPDYAAFTSFTGLAAYSSLNFVKSGSNVRDLGLNTDVASSGPLWVGAPYPLRDEVEPFVGTKAQVREYLETSVTQSPFDIGALPRDTRLLTWSPGPGVKALFPRLNVVADTPIFRSGDIEKLRIDGSRMIATIRPQARTRVGDALRLNREATTPVWSPVVMTFSGSSGVLPVVGYVSDAESAVDGSTVVIDGYGTDPARTFEAAFGAEQPIGATTSVEQTEPYGEVPPIAGEKVPLPTWLEEARKRVMDYTSGGPTVDYYEVPRDTIVRVLTTQSPEGDLALWAGRAPDRSDIVWLERDGQLHWDGACDPRPGLPPLTTCIAGFGSGDSLFVGRVGPTVTGVARILSDNSSQLATVQNGWYLILGGPPKDRSVQLTAFDISTGAVIAMTDTRGAPTPLPPTP